MMELKIKGNPGNGNHYKDVMMEHVGSYNPAAREVNIFQTSQTPQSRLVSWFAKLQEDFKNDGRLQKKMDDIMRYRNTLHRKND